MRRAQPGGTLACVAPCLPSVRIAADGSRPSRSRGGTVAAATVRDALATLRRRFGDGRRGAWRRCATLRRRSAPRLATVGAALGDAPRRFGHASRRLGVASCRPSRSAAPTVARPSPTVAEASRTVAKASQRETVTYRNRAFVFFRFWDRNGACTAAEGHRNAQNMQKTPQKSIQSVRNR